MNIRSTERFVHDAFSKAGLVPFDFSNKDKPADWAVTTARAVMADLSDYHALRWQLDGVPEKQRAFIIEILAAIIREGESRKTVTP